jgi:hypothetical protein
MVRATLFHPPLIPMKTLLLRVFPFMLIALVAGCVARSAAF